MSVQSQLPKTLKLEAIAEVRRRFSSEQIGAEGNKKGSEVHECLGILAKEKMDILNVLKSVFHTLGDAKVTRQIEAKEGDVWVKYQALVEEKAKLKTYSALKEVVDLTGYVTHFQSGVKGVAMGAAALAYYYRRSDPLIAVASGVFVLAMGVLFKVTSEFKGFLKQMKPIFEDESVNPENTSTLLNEMIADVYKRAGVSTHFLSRYFARSASSYVDHRSKEEVKPVDYDQMFKGQVEGLKALKSRVTGEAYLHSYRTQMAPEKMRVTYDKLHGVLSPLQKGTYLWGGMATVLTAYAFYRRAYLMIGAALTHVGGAYYLSRIIRSRVSQAAELKAVTGDVFNDTYMRLFYSQTKPAEGKQIELIQAQVIQLDTILKLIPQNGVKRSNMSVQRKPVPEPDETTKALPK